jgi:hypothetical protein
MSIYESPDFPSLGGVILYGTKKGVPMVTENIWQRSVDLTNRVFNVTSGLNVPRGNQWPTAVTVFLTQANERLDSIRAVLDRNGWDSGVILTRSLFELAANLAYIAEDEPGRLPRYLQHGGIPSTSEEAEKLQNELQKAGEPEAKGIIPRKAWKPLKDICTDLGSSWLKEYDTFYRYASVPTHAGSFTLGQSFSRLLEQQPPSDHEKAEVLLTGLAFHLRVAEIAATTFPSPIGIEKVKKLHKECSNLGRSLLNS